MGVMNEIKRLFKRKQSQEKSSEAKATDDQVAISTQSSSIDISENIDHDEESNTYDVSSFMTYDEWLEKNNNAGMPHSTAISLDVIFKQNAQGVDEVELGLSFGNFERRAFEYGQASYQTAVYVRTFIRNYKLMVKNSRVMETRPDSSTVLDTLLKEFPMALKQAIERNLQKIANFKTQKTKDKYTIDLFLALKTTHSNVPWCEEAIQEGISYILTLVPPNVIKTIDEHYTNTLPLRDEPLYTDGDENEEQEYRDRLNADYRKAINLDKK